MNTFVDLVKQYSNWKLQEKGSAKLTRNELTALRESFNKNRQPAKNKLKEETIKKLNSTLKETVGEYRAWKLENHGSNKITENELAGLKKAVLQKVKLQESSSSNMKSNMNWSQYVENYKKFKESKEPGAKLTYKELKLLKETFKTAVSKGIKLREADVGFDPNQAAPVAGDPNAMAGADPNAAAMGGAPQDPLAMQGAIDQAISALTPFSQAGANTLAADPNAGIPPVDGTQPAQPPMAPPLAEAINQYKAWKLREHGSPSLTDVELKSLQEKFGAKPKTKYEQIQERIAARQAKLKSLQEGHGLDVKTISELGDLGTPASTGADRGGSEAGEELVKVPAANSLANGYSSGKAAGETKPAKTWPTKAVGKEAGGALQGAGASQSKIKENEECCDDNKEDKETLQEKEVKTVTDIYVDKYFEPKLSFDKIRESMKSGLLG
jgi:hypothetical protein